MKDIIKPIVVLACICLVVTTLLAVVNSVTAPIISAAEEAAAATARSEVLIEAKDFEKLNNISLPDGVTEAYAGTDGSGYVFMLTQKGYGGDIKLICGMRPDGSIEAMQTLSHSETKGIGSRVVDNDSPETLSKAFAGKTADNQDEVEAISGATISSKAYKAAVKSAFAAFDAVKGAKA